MARAGSPGSGSMPSAALSFVGVLVTFCGHLVAAALERYKAAERAADEMWFAEMASMSDMLNDAGVFDHPESLKRVLREHRMRYEVEHQDDGR